MLSRRFIFFIVLAGAIAVLGGAAFAAAPDIQLLTRGSTGSLDVTHNGVSLKTDGPTDAAVATLTFAPEASTGWHHHPGLVVLVVKSGTITLYDKDCQKETHKAGDAFVESSDTPGLAINRSPKEAVLEATFIVPSSGNPAAPTPLRIDDTPPTGCTVS